MLKRRSAARTPDTARLFVRDSPFMFNSLSPVSRVLEGPEDRIGIVGYHDGVESGAPARDLEGGARRDVVAVHRELRQDRYLPRRVNPSDERPRVAIEVVTRHRDGGTGPACSNRGRGDCRRYDSDGIRDRLAVEGAVAELSRQGEERHEERLKLLLEGVHVRPERGASAEVHGRLRAGREGDEVLCRVVLDDSVDAAVDRVDDVVRSDDRRALFLPAFAPILLTRALDRGDGQRGLWPERDRPPLGVLVRERDLEDEGHLVRHTYGGIASHRNPALVGGSRSEGYRRLYPGGRRAERHGSRRRRAQPGVKFTAAVARVAPEFVDKVVPDPGSVRGGGGGRLDVRDHDRVGGRRERRDRGCRRASHGRAERREQPGGGVARKVVDGDRARYRGGEGGGNRIRACAAGGGQPDVG